MIDNLSSAFLDALPSAGTGIGAGLLGIAVAHAALSAQQAWRSFWRSV